MIWRDMVGYGVHICTTSLLASTPLNISACVTSLLYDAPGFSACLLLLGRRVCI